jgi:hypothetical protein
MLLSLKYNRPGSHCHALVLCSLFSRQSPHVGKALIQALWTTNDVGGNVVKNTILL